MAKKGLLIFVLAAIVAGGAFAQAPINISVGAGGFIGGDFGGGVKASMSGINILKMESP